MKVLFLPGFLLLSIFTWSQSVGIGTTAPDPSAQLDISSSNKGLLMPRLTTASRTAIANPARGLMVFDSTTNSVWYYDTRWRELAPQSGAADSLLASTNPGVALNMGHYIRSDSFGTIYDSGGPAGNYSNNENFTTTLVPPAGALFCHIQLFSYNIENNFDSLVLIPLSNPSNRIRISGTFTGPTPVSYLLDASQGIVIRFQSDANITSSGFHLRFTHQFRREGTGTGFYFISEKMAVRGGMASGGSWTTDSSGLFSFSYGLGAKAKGAYSFSNGLGSNASGENAIALGQAAFAGGRNSVAIGANTNANGEGGFALGSGSTASAGSVGIRGQASGSSIAIGGQATSGSFAFGGQATNASFALGGEATGSSSVSIGSGSIASGYFSRALIGTASGSFSVAMGYEAGAEGNGSSAAGWTTFARGQATSTFGYGTVAKGVAATVVGMFNDTLNTPNQSITSYTGQTPLFVVGNGSAYNARSNAFIVRHDGNVGIGNLVPEYRLDVGGRMRLRGITGNANHTAGIWLNNINNTGITGFMGVFSDNQMGFFGNSGAAWGLLFNTTTGNLNVGGSVFQNSDLRLKQNIQPLSQSLQQLSRIRGYQYHWKDANADSSVQTGLIAQEVQEVFPQLVSKNNNGFLSVNYIGLVPYLVEATKELKRENELLKQQLQQQQKELAEIKQQVAELLKRK